MGEQLYRVFHRAHYYMFSCFTMATSYEHAFNKTKTLFENNKYYDTKYLEHTEVSKVHSSSPEMKQPRDIVTSNSTYGAPRC